MNVELNQGQFLNLIEALHISTHLRGDAETENLEQQMLRWAYESGMNEIVMRTDEGYALGSVYAKALHDEVHRYEDTVLWSGLAEELAVRDLSFVKSEEEIDQLADDEYDAIIGSQAGRYASELALHGVDHLTLAHQLPIA